MSKYLAFLVTAFMAACSNANYGYMKDGQPFAEAIVREVGASWDANALISKADPEMTKDHPESELREMIAKCSETFGPLTQIEALAGEVNTAGEPSHSVVYTFAAKGQKLNVQIRIMLRKSDGNWKVLGFWVRS